MSKRYLGIICLLYSGIITYVWIFDKLKNFLAPQMQIYLKLSLIPMLLMGLVILFNNKVHYKFKISDLVLILPLILLIFAGDGRLTAGFANNRMTNFNSNQKNETEEKLKDESKDKNGENSDSKLSQDTKEEKEEVVNEEPNETYDFSNVYFDVTDPNYDTLSTYITGVSKASKFAGKTIRVRGFAVKQASYLPKGYFAIGKYTISCCAADAGFTGFFAKYDAKKIRNNTWYEIEGILEKGKDKAGNSTMYIKVINIKEIDSSSEEQYVYPCYSYGDGLCSEVLKYDLVV